MAFVAAREHLAHHPPVEALATALGQRADGVDAPGEHGPAAHLKRQLEEPDVTDHAVSLLDHDAAQWRGEAGLDRETPAMQT